MYIYIYIYIIIYHINDIYTLIYTLICKQKNDVVLIVSANSNLIENNLINSTILI